MRYSVAFPNGVVDYLLNSSFSKLSRIVPTKDCVIITDDNILKLYKKSFAKYKSVISVKAAETSKSIETVLDITQQLVTLEAHRTTHLIGVGGGMVTDITGMVASLYMRGVPYGFVPTSLLGMVDASIGGKNGINVDLQKNLLGTINQPNFILFDRNFLQTLPEKEWSNGFAEVIKYACLFDKEMFDELAQNDLWHYQHNIEAMDTIIGKCIDWKNKIVLADERENWIRKLLNFGHTAGHAFETVCDIPHGEAVALGMLVACKLSELYGLDKSVLAQLKELLIKYELPVNKEADVAKLMQVLSMDKKRNNDCIDFIVLDSIGNASIKPMTMETIKKAVESFTHASRRRPR